MKTVAVPPVLLILLVLFFFAPLAPGLSHAQNSGRFPIVGGSTDEDHRQPSPQPPQDDIFPSFSNFGGQKKETPRPEPERPSPDRPKEAAVEPGAEIEVTEEGGIVLNFDDADILKVIRLFADLLKFNYVLDPEVGGSVTIHTSGSIGREDLFPLFFQILAVNGLTAVKQGSVYHITGLAEAPRQPIDASSTRPGAGSRPSVDGDAVIQIIKLRHIAAQEMAKLLTPFVSANGTVVSHEGTGTVVLADRAANIAKLLKLVRAFDTSLFSQADHRFYSLEHADPEDTAEAISQILSAYPAPSGPGSGPKIIPLPRLRMLLAIGSDDRVFQKVRSLVRQFDVPLTDAEPKIHVYFVKNGKAGELADVLTRVFSEGPAPVPAGTSRSREGRRTADQPSQGEPASFRKRLSFEDDETIEASDATTTEAGSRNLRRGIRIHPDEIRNALIIEATPADYRRINEILESLDVLPRQVLIEVTVADITLSASTDLGVEWEYVRGSGGMPDTSWLSGNMGAAGLQYVIGQVDRWKATLSALAKEDKVNILSSPTLLASDNKEAKIDISTEIPVASAQYEYQSEGTPLLQTNIQYRNTGVILSVTPHINEFGLVSMDVSQEVSEQSENVNVGNESLPSFFKRSVNTSLTVKHGQTIVIGGLIRENVSDGHSGVPCLGGIPGLGVLFGKQVTSREKTELIILITPRVISTLQDVDVITEEFKNKIGEILPPEAR